MTVKMTDFQNELVKYGIGVKYESGRLELTGGDEEAREHYTAVLQASPEFEGALIWKLAQTDADIMDSIEERRAIKWVETGDDSLRSAILGNITQEKGKYCQQRLAVRGSK